MSQQLREQVNVCAMRAAPSSRCCHPISSLGSRVWAMEQTAGADGAEGAGTARVRAQLLCHLPSGGFLLMPKPNQSFHLELELYKQVQDFTEEFPPLWCLDCP